MVNNKNENNSDQEQVDKGYAALQERQERASKLFDELCDNNRKITTESLITVLVNDGEDTLDKKARADKKPGCGFFEDLRTRCRGSSLAR